MRISKKSRVNMKKLVTISIMSMATVVLVTLNSAHSMETVEYVIALVFGMAVMIPFMALLVYSIQHAGIPLLKDFIDGDTFERILIFVILVSLFYAKLIV